jgi:hypothetical protein
MKTHPKRSRIKAQLPKLPMPDECRCDPACDGWFVNSESGAPERCDDCARACKAHGLDEPTDADAFALWITEVVELVEDLATTNDPRIDALFPLTRN